MKERRKVRFEILVLDSFEINVETIVELNEISAFDNIAVSLIRRWIGNEAISKK